MLYLILMVSLVFLIFYVGDFILTLKTIKYAGTKVEINPLMKLRGKFIYVFKGVEIVIFFVLIYFLSTIQITTSFYLLLTFIFLYGLLVVNNANVYYKVTGRASKLFDIIFMIILLFILFFIYLNYILYSDIKTVYGALLDSNEKYSNLYTQCFKEENIINSTITKDISKSLENLNLTINKPSFL